MDYPTPNEGLSQSQPNTTMHQNPPSHSLPMDDPENPMNWPLLRKLYTSFVAFSFTFVLLFGATCYTAGLAGIQKEFGVSMEKAVGGFSIYIFGIFFAPLVSPHISESIGRSYQYFICMFGNALFTIGVAYSQSYTSMMVCRFFAGLFGGPSAVLIEGTFADIWPALYTGTYYSFLTCASYFGAAVGAMIGHSVVPAVNGDWRWTQYLTLIFSLAAFLVGLGVPETYGREILRQRARRMGRKANLPAAPTGQTLAQMAKLTVTDPIIMLVSEPLVIMITLYLALNFGVLFQWFITVPAVLSGVYSFTDQQIGKVFAAAIGGTVMGAVSTAAIDQVTVRVLVKKRGHMSDIEHRLIPAMVGAVLLIASLFWVDFTAKPTVSFYAPIIGTAFYVWGSAMTLIAFVGYLFDAYPPQGTLSGLTTAACLRIALAGIIPLVILTAFQNLTGKWALSVFGFVFVAFLPFPFVLYVFGPRLRMSSRFSKTHNMTPLQAQQMTMAKDKSASHSMSA